MAARREVWFLGRHYGPFKPEEAEHRWGQYQRFLRHAQSRLWFTYRTGFENIGSTPFRSDTGWGCMLRSGQMLLGETLVRHILSENWRLGRNMRETVQRYSEILSWFLDKQSPSTPYSLHRIALEGRKLDKAIGEWFGPSTISAVLQTLVNAHRPYGLAAYVARDGVVCKDQVLEAARRPPPELRFPPTPTAPPPPPPMTVEHLPGDDDGTNGEDDPGHGGGELELTAPADWSTHGPDAPAAFASNGVDDGQSAATTDGRSPSSAEPFNSVLILIPLRLGLQTLNEIYDGAIKACFRFPQCVGIAGGRPNSSLWFTGYDGNNVFYLDPHYPRRAVESRDQLSSYTEEDWSSYHTNVLRTIDIRRIDPSLMLGFYCRTLDDLEDFFRRVEGMNSASSAIFSVQETMPDYVDDDGMLMSDDDDEGRADDVGDDDYDLL